MPRRAELLLGAWLASGLGLLVLPGVGQAEDPGPLELVAAPPGPTPAPPGSLAELAAGLRRSVAILSAASRSDPTRTFFGSGFVVTADGYLVTTDVRVASGLDPRAKLADGQRVPLELVARDPNSELALLRIRDVEPSRLSLVPAPLGDSDQVRAGDWVLTLGQADGLEPSLGKGVIAGRERAAGRLTGTPDPLFQLDMRLLSTFAGAPLADTRGRVIGILVRSLAPDETPVRFALPINRARALLEQMASRVPAPSGWLGVQILPERDSPSAGAVVEGVIEDSPAARADLHAGDVIVEFDGQRVRSLTDLSAFVARVSPGREVEVVVMRDGVRTPARAEIAPRAPSPRGPRAAEPAGGPGFGLVCAELDDSRRALLSLPASARGIVVADLLPRAPAARADLQIGDQILEIDRAPVRTCQDVATRLRGSSPLLLVRRGPTTRLVVLAR